MFDRKGAQEQNVLQAELLKTEPAGVDLCYFLAMHLLFASKGTWMFDSVKQKRVLWDFFLTLFKKKPQHLISYLFNFKSISSAV